MVVVEGDTEYSAFKYFLSEVAAGKIEGFNSNDFNDIHIVRARGKATIVSLCKILNQFGTPYSILHDSDAPFLLDKKGNVLQNKDGSNRKNSAWAINQNILEAIKSAPFPEKIRVLASRKNFESAFLDEEVTADKPYNAIRELTESPEKLKVIGFLLIALTNAGHSIPDGALDSRHLKEDDLKMAA